MELFDNEKGYYKIVEKTSDNILFIAHDFIYSIQSRVNAANYKSNIIEITKEKYKELCKKISENNKSFFSK